MPRANRPQARTDAWPPRRWRAAPVAGKRLCRGSRSTRRRKTMRQREREAGRDTKVFAMGSGNTAQVVPSTTQSTFAELYHRADPSLGHPNRTVFQSPRHSRRQSVATRNPPSSLSPRDLDNPDAPMNGVGSTSSRAGIPVTTRKNRYMPAKLSLVTTFFHPLPAARSRRRPTTRLVRPPRQDGVRPKRVDPRENNPKESW